MQLSYQPITGGDRQTIKATVTTEHSLSSYGQPVVLLGDGGPLNAESWVLLQYRIERASDAEVALLWRAPFFWPEINGPGAPELARYVAAKARSDSARHAGSTTSTARAEASRNNGRKGGRPRKDE